MLGERLQHCTRQCGVVLEYDPHGPFQLQFRYLIPSKCMQEQENSGSYCPSELVGQKAGSPTVGGARANDNNNNLLFIRRPSGWASPATLGGFQKNIKIL
ncbi:Hypothetical predicted protein [Podarcis lilfordi]|uniref:Uncharacterized protein n=1 Tax=Podarcis lilfordi TaxID=74358 RepID=A0AA35LMK0_9SAUR|nr:Hypothetical predicted protein [Podarcis lilfordi]